MAALQAVCSTRNRVLGLGDGGLGSGCGGIVRRSEQHRRSRWSLLLQGLLAAPVPAGRVAEGGIPATFSTRAMWRAEPVSTPKVEQLLDSIKWNESGLAVAIAQEVDTGEILMQGFVNRDAVSATLASKRATFFSRSRDSLWTKGETSSNFINVVDVLLDCDRDSIIYLGKPDGPTCHTGAETCYFTQVLDDGQDGDAVARTTLMALEATIERRKNEGGGGKPSWTKRLLEDQALLCSKVREEANELCQTLEEEEGKARAASEMADLLYHSMVLLSAQGVNISQVLEILRLRFRRSGIEEKNSRSKP